LENKLNRVFEQMEMIEVLLEYEFARVKTKDAHFPGGRLDLMMF